MPELFAFATKRSRRKVEKYKTTLLRIGTCHSINLSAADGTAAATSDTHTHTHSLSFSLLLPFPRFAAFSSLSVPRRDTPACTLYFSFSPSLSLFPFFLPSLSPLLLFSLCSRLSYLAFYTRSRRASIPNRARAHVRPVTPHDSARGAVSSSAKLYRPSFRSTRFVLGLRTPAAKRTHNSPVAIYRTLQGQICGGLR